MNTNCEQPRAYRPYKTTPWQFIKFINIFLIQNKQFFFLHPKQAIYFWNFKIVQAQTEFQLFMQKLL